MLPARRMIEREPPIIPHSLVPRMSVCESHAKYAIPLSVPSTFRILEAFYDMVVDTWGLYYL